MCGDPPGWPLNARELLKPANLLSATGRDTRQVNLVYLSRFEVPSYPAEHSRLMLGQGELDLGNLGKHREGDKLRRFRAKISNRERLAYKRPRVCLQPDKARRAADRNQSPFDFYMCGSAEMPGINESVVPTALLLQERCHIEMDKKREGERRERV